MVDVISIKFKNRGKCYFFSPNGLTVKSGDKVIVETSKGLEIADCCRGNHPVADDAVVQPLRPVVRIATADDLRVAEINKKREKEAFDICQQKIAEHELDMKLVDVECNFEGSKTMFFFTSDGRVDFRELVKDLAGIFRNRIELRQIGVRDEAKMLGGIGICGRPYCCSQFLEDFQPVSTKMAKVQSLSLNPTKISGSCGRLMCCLRYEQEAYEELVKKVPKQGAFVETKDGFGTAVQVNLLRQTVQVKLDGDAEDSVRTFKANELCAVPGGRPRDGEAPVSTFKYVPEPEEEEEEEIVNQWELPSYESAEEPASAPEEASVPKSRERRQRKRRASSGEAKNHDKPQEPKPRKQENGAKREAPAKNDGGEKGEKGEKSENRPSRRSKRGKGGAVKVAAHVQQQKPSDAQPPKSKGGETKPSESKNENAEGKKPEGEHKRNNRRRYYHGKPKAKPSGEGKA